jgi:hypothetical protein
MSKFKLVEGVCKMKYPIDPKMQKRLDNDYTYHKPFGDQQQRYEEIRESAKNLALVIVEMTPPSREQSVALTLLEQTVMEANAAIARNEEE